MFMHLIMEHRNTEAETERLRREIDKYTCIVFNASPSIIDRTSKQKLSKDIEDFTDTINKIYLLGIYRTLHPETAERPFFSNKGTWDIFQDGIYSEP